MSARVRLLFRYIIPAMGGLFVTYLYNVVDGIFVGRGVGSAGLGAVNLAVPFITSVVAIAAMFPMGGATITAIRMGRGDKSGANQAFVTSLLLTIIFSIILMAVGMLFSRQIVILNGAGKVSGSMREMASQYLFYYSAFSIPMLLSTCLSVFVRNDGSPVLSFVGMCVGAAANIFLDWLFIFPFKMGVVGAAIASGLGQVSSVLILLSHFIRGKGDLHINKIHLDSGLIRKICRRGVPEAVTELATPVTALCYNIVTARMIGDIGISTFSVLSFISSLANAVLSGVAQGLQPLWGVSYGKNDVKEIKWYLRWGTIINLILSVAIYVLLYWLDRPIIRIFNRETELVQMAASALPAFALSFIPMSVNLILTAYLFSTKKTGMANAIAVSRGIVAKALCIFCIPAVFGSRAVWTAPFAAEMVTLLIAVFLEKRDHSR